MESTVDEKWQGKDLCEGDSFGEEILLGFEDKFQYTVLVTSERVKCHVIPEEDFLKCFLHMPEVVEQMRENAKSIHDRPKPHAGRPSLFNGNGTIPNGFPEKVISLLEEIIVCL